MKKPYFARKLFLLLACFSLEMVGCKGGKHEELTGVFDVTNPWRENVEITRQYVAQIRAIQHIEIRAYEKGYLQKIFVDEGQPIKKHTKMFQIMPNIMGAEYEKAHAEYEISKIEYENTKVLVDQKRSRFCFL